MVRAMRLEGAWVCVCRENRERSGDALTNCKLIIVRNETGFAALNRSLKLISQKNVVRRMNGWEHWVGSRIQNDFTKYNIPISDSVTI